MKVYDIAKKHGYDWNDLDSFLTKESGLPFKHGLRDTIFNDSDEDKLVALYEKKLAEERLSAEERAKRREEWQRESDAKKAAEALAAEEKRKALASMLISSGFNFDGYTITKYSGYISGDDVIQVARGRDGFFSSATNVGASLMQSLVRLRRNALNELKEAAYDLGCNAVIGVDFDYLTLDPQTANSSGGTTYLPYVFGVTANGNAVFIEKIEK